MRYSDEVLEKRTGHYIIWNNKDKKIGGCQIFYKEWVTKGIIYIHDLWNINENFLSYEEFKQRLSLNESFLRYIGIVKCLKMLIRTNQQYKDICKTTKPTTYFNSSVFKLIDESIIDIKKLSTFIL